MDLEFIRADFRPRQPGVNLGLQLRIGQVIHRRWPGGRHAGSHRSLRAA
jgi:hypothetical protein